MKIVLNYLTNVIQYMQLYASNNRTFILKFFLLFIFISSNTFVSTLTWYYDKYYWYLAIISLGTLYKAILIILISFYFTLKCIKYIFRLRVKDKEKSLQTFKEKPLNSIAFVVPCYTEDYDKVNTTLQSLKTCIEYSRNVFRFNPLIIVIVDGENKGKGCDKKTGDYVMDIIGYENTIAYGSIVYESWKGGDVTCEYTYNTWFDIDVMVMVKKSNMGKKDSLILIRDILYNYNIKNKEIEYLRMIIDIISNINTNRTRHVIFDYIIGVDTGSYFSENAVEKLVRKIHKDDDVIGVSGFIKVHLDNLNWKNFWTFYQYFEYIFQQGLTRLGQSVIGSVTCLPGCLQIMRICDETMKEPLNEFRKLPDPESDYEKIRAYLGEDRRFTCLMLYKNPKKMTTICTDALVYTDVPTTFSVLLSQRRRWFLSSQANNIADFFSNLPILIRFIAIVQIWTFLFAIVTLICAARLIWIIVLNHNIIVLAAFSSLIFIGTYKNLLALIYAESFGKFCYMLMSMLVYTLICPFINTYIGIYAMYTMDDYSWGKTQMIEKKAEGSYIEISLNNKEIVNQDPSTEVIAMPQDVKG